MFFNIDQKTKFFLKSVTNVLQPNFELSKITRKLASVNQKR
jgi:hypothetical protein